MLPSGVTVRSSETTGGHCPHRDLLQEPGSRPGSAGHTGVSVPVLRMSPFPREALTLLYGTSLAGETAPNFRACEPSSSPRATNVCVCMCVCVTLILSKMLSYLIFSLYNMGCAEAVVGHGYKNTWKSISYEDWGVLQRKEVCKLQHEQTWTGCST